MVKRVRLNDSDSSSFSPRNDKRLSAGKGGAQSLGPYSRVIDRGVLGAIDGRSREGRFLLVYESQLTEHCGGHPNIVQRALINRAARLALHLELMDERSLAGDHIFTTHDHLHYVSWSNALARLLARLGLEPSTAPFPPMDALQYGHQVVARRTKSRERVRL
jgi:hypothetical protein